MGAVGVVAVLSIVAISATSYTGEDQQGSPAHRMSVWVGGTGLGGSIGTLFADNARVGKDVANGGRGPCTRPAGRSKMTPRWPTGSCPRPTQR